MNRNPNVSFPKGFDARWCALELSMQDIDSSALVESLYGVPWVSSAVRYPDRVVVSYGDAVRTADTVRARLIEVVAKLTEQSVTASR